MLANSAPYPPADQVTHAFLKRRPNAPSHSGSQSDAPNLPAGCQDYEWLRLEFLCAHLMDAGNTSRSEYAFDFKGEQSSAPPPKRSRTVRWRWRRRYGVYISSMACPLHPHLSICLFSHLFFFSCCMCIKKHLMLKKTRFGASDSLFWGLIN